MDMRYHWLTDRVRQKQFDVYWRPGREHLGEYHSKHHSVQHHKDMRHLILHEANSLQVLRGCVKLLPLPQPPVRARADEPKRPESHPTKECARARVRCLNTEPNYYYCPITLVMS
jgi:trehalose utilization protein